ncbi:MAG: hypothetical protein E7335_01765 [Clostridiales bacterium]|nr:hypothetical protein [Clostridiales bacterium]
MRLRKWLKRLICMTICMLFSVPGMSPCERCAMAEEWVEGTPMPRYRFITGATVQLNFTGAGVASCYGSASMIGTASSINLTLTLWQKQTRKRSTEWCAIATWNDEKANTMLFAIDHIYSAVPAGTYRLTLSVVATDQDGVEEYAYLTGHDRVYDGY